MCWLVETYFEKGVISEKICKMIYTWNTERGCENWNMNDVMKVLYFPFGRLIMWIFFMQQWKSSWNLESLNAPIPK